MIEAADQFKARLLKMKVGETYTYYRGFLAQDRIGRPALDAVAVLVFGLDLIGKVRAFQKRALPLEETVSVPNSKDKSAPNIEKKVAYAVSPYEYSLRLLRPIRQADFVWARNEYIKQLRIEEAA